MASSSCSSSTPAPLTAERSTTATTKPERNVRVDRFVACLSKNPVDMSELKELLWSGVPEDSPNWVRSKAWKIMIGYMPVHEENQLAGIQRKREEYRTLCREYHNLDTSSDDDKRLLRQIKVDLPRMQVGPGLKLFQHPSVTLLMERVLFVWATRHPASGYVQGINDLITPFISVFLSEYLPEGISLSECDIDTHIHTTTLDDVEADVYSCLSRVLSLIQDNYVSGQPGIQRQVSKVTDIVKRVDEPLYTHLNSNNVDFLHVVFRWMNCLLLREMPLKCVVRIWDTYIAQSDGFSCFHVYVCVSFLLSWSAQIRGCDFQGILVLVQKLPTHNYTLREVESLIAEAYVLKTLFHQSPKHLE
eukprot:GHVR01058085.1.p1 GENE.GHVR01058085.1~~GHVR01058085.1.p1  ORF type:complete len:360 (-),score=50.84 GHVR01058085.1:73-1152(-)